MRVRAALTTLALVPATALTLAAAPADGCTTLDAGADPVATEDDVLACVSTQYLAGCDGYAGGKVYQGLAHGETVMLVPEAPEGSYTDGAGCGTVDDPFLVGTRQSTAFSLDLEGWFETNADTMTVELHDISASTMRALRTTPLDVRVSIDGASPLGTEVNESVNGTPSNSPKTVTIDAEAIASETGISDALVFTITNLRDVLPADLYTAGTGEEKQVLLTIDVPLDGAHAFVWGASEIASNITFNGEVRGAVVDAREHA